MSIHGFCEAICIEDASDWSTKEAVPTKDQVIHWLGCLGGVTKDILHLSHFTVVEFLQNETGIICSPAIQDYLVVPEDQIYILEVCLICVSHDQFRQDYLRNVPTESPDEIESFLDNRLLYQYAVATLPGCLKSLNDSENYDNQLIRSFLSVPSSRAFKLWATCYGFPGCDPGMSSPIYFASATGLVSQVSRLLEEGADPDGREDLEDSIQTPLHLASSGIGWEWYYDFDQSIPQLYHEMGSEGAARECNWKILRMLLDSGADVNRQVVYQVIDDNSIDIAVTPLTLALLWEHWEMASFLLDVGADWGATAQNTQVNDMCSVKRFIEWRPEWKDGLQRTLRMSSQSGLTEKLVEEWKLQQDTNDSDILSDPDTNDSHTLSDAQDLFMDAFSNARWQEVCDLLAQHADLNVDCLNERGFGALHYASIYEGDALSVLVNYGAAVNQFTRYGSTALSVACERGCVGNMRLLLKSGASIEHRATNGYTPLCVAVFHRRQDALQLLYEAGADINASICDGSTALNLAIKNHDTRMVSWLLAKGIDRCRPDHFGTTPLHDACEYGLQDQVGLLLRLSPEPQAYVNATSLVLGTALYIVAKNGDAFIIKTLLNNGAMIDKVEPGNLLGSPLMAACAYGHCEAVEILLANGAALEIEGAMFRSAE
ncbi:MAG: hypothetical protein Q9223_006740, partial [Gallowayella weberi]